MRGDTGLVEYSLVYEQIHVPCGNGLNTKSVRCARRKCGAMRTHGNVCSPSRRPYEGVLYGFFFVKYEISTRYLNISIMHHAVHKNSL